MLRRNLIANYIGQGWASLSSFIFLPVYLHYLGLEAYGLIGFFAMLQAWFTLLDAGLGPTLGREMARYTGGARSSQSIRDLLTSVELISFTVASILVLLLWWASAFIADWWLVSNELDKNTVKNALSLMGIAAALRVIEGIYRSALLGLQKQVLFNYLLIGSSTLKSVGAVLVLVSISASITAFFIWQVLASTLTVLTLAYFSRTSLPLTNQRGRFSLEEISGVFSYAKGMLLITALSLLLMQVDKIILSKTLSLSEFGIYSLASTVAMATLILVTPITQAWFPKLSQLHAMNDNLELTKVFHLGAQIVTVVLGSAAVILCLFSEQILKIWTQDTYIAEKAAPILGVLILGNLLNGLMWIPYQAQLAHGWTSLSVKINLWAVIFLTPLTIWTASNYGPYEVSLIWLALNSIYVLVGGKLMFNHILKGEFRDWLVNDICKPFGAAVLTALTFKAISPDDLSSVSQILFIGMASTVTLIGSSYCAQSLRKSFLIWLQK